MFFSWLKKRRRRRILAEPVPPAWPAILQEHFDAHVALTPSQRSRLVDDLRVFIAEKEWEGCGGLELTDDMRVTIAAHACRMILGLDINYFSLVQTILVYPAGYHAREEVPMGGGVVMQRDSDRLGEAHRRGPVVLSWDDVLEAARNPGRGENLVYHEFAHKLDMLNGEADGIPPIDDGKLIERWLKVLPAELDSLRRASAAGRETLLDPYGAENEAEFFAVASECFFDLPQDLRARHPRLYAILGEFYRQDPAA
ncbi:MAG: zinc-dependent peptidase [Planctomycetes bacterium]|nr:zinc-dependent peptidase [Planctomycetota bacterium]